MKRWRANFKAESNMKTYDRSRWDGKHDLIIEGIVAPDREAARVEAFRLADKYIICPFLDELEEM